MPANTKHFFGEMRGARAGFTTRSCPAAHFFHCGGGSGRQRSLAGFAAGVVDGAELDVGGRRRGAAGGGHLGLQLLGPSMLPAILALFLRALLPESPRWLAVHGRNTEAEAAVSLIERETQKATGQPLPPVQPVVATSQQRATLADLFGATYLQRTLVVWVIWFSAYFVNYGLSIWLPTIYRTVFKLPLDVSLRYGLITQAVGMLGALICALTIDYIGRRIWFAIAFAAAALSLGWLATIANPAAEQVLTFMTIAYFFVSTINLGVYLYTPELYPTRVQIGRAHV